MLPMPSSSNPALSVTRGKGQSISEPEYFSLSELWVHEESPGLGEGGGGWPIVQWPFPYCCDQCLSPHGTEVAPLGNAFADS
jgi:hypothetical protein